MEVEYKWSTYRGSAKTNHYKKDVAISTYTDLEELNKDNVNYVFATKRLGLTGRKFHDFSVTEIFSHKEIPTPK